MSTYPDLEEAEQYLNVISEMVSTEMGGCSSPRSLRRIEFACRSANGALRDLVWQDHLDDVKTFASALYSDAEHLQWAKHELSGAAYLRMQLTKTLNALSTRLAVLHAKRQSQLRPSTTAAAGAL